MRPRIPGACNLNQQGCGNLKSHNSFCFSVSLAACRKRYGSSWGCLFPIRFAEFQLMGTTLFYVQLPEKWKGKNTDGTVVGNVRKWGVCVLYLQGCLVSAVLKSNPITGLDRHRGFQEVEASRFQDSRHMKVVRLSALRTGRLYPPGNIPGTHFC